jgi:hypothetical protein
LSKLIEKILNEDGPCDSSKLAEKLIEKGINGSFRFEFWTTSKFSLEAREYLSELKQKTKKFQIGFKEGIEICDLLTTIGKKKLTNKLKRYYKIKKYT